jgi:putative tryptophan/tyrosine transport system substrate-binding protein
MKRREFITLLGGAAVAWPLAVRAQQSAMPVIGFFSTTSPKVYEIRLRAFRQGLKEQEYIEGQNVAVEYRWAGDDERLLPVLAGELVRRPVTVIAAGGTPSTVAAKAVTATIPIVFETAGDPVALGFVSSLSRPGGNLTGVTNLNVEVAPKRLELLHELMPAATTIAVLVNPAGPTLTEQFLRELQAAAAILGMRLHVLEANSDRELDVAFADMRQLRVDGFIVGPYLFFNSRAERLGALALRHALPGVFQYRPFAAAGGLMSYGAHEGETYRLVGIQVGKILKGEKPSDLPVQRSTKVELIINLKTANALGLTVPLSLLGRADEVIE